MALLMSLDLDFGSISALSLLMFFGGSGYIGHSGPSWSFCRASGLYSDIGQSSNAVVETCVSPCDRAGDGLISVQREDSSGHGSANFFRSVVTLMPACPAIFSSAALAQDVECLVTGGPGGRMVQNTCGHRVRACWDDNSRWESEADTVSLLRTGDLLPAAGSGRQQLLKRRP
jgi:hypothetical protein